MAADVESKEDGNDLPYDQAKVEKVMKIVAVKETKKAAAASWRRRKWTTNQSQKVE